MAGERRQIRPRIPEELYAQLEEIARRLGVPVSAYIVMVLHDRATWERIGQGVPAAGGTVATATGRDGADTA